MTSGTLAFALGSGTAVVSTPYWAAEELLAQGRGRFVNFADPQGIAKTILEIINDDSLADQMRKRAYQYTRSMTWPKVAQQYWNLFENKTKSIPARTPQSLNDDFYLHQGPNSRSKAYQTA